MIRQANDTVYGLASAVFSQDINKALNTARRLKAGTAWVRVLPIEQCEAQCEARSLRDTSQSG